MKFALMLGLFIAVSLLLPPAHAAERPNIIVIISDDHGYADMGCQGIRDDVQTPNLDRIASNGVRFTSGYVTSPVCSPSRAGMITGRYQTRFGYEFNTGPFPEPHIGLPPDEQTIAQYLKESGYVTGAIGKWHLGIADTYHPLARGFDEFYGFLSGSRSYFEMTTHHAKPLLRGREPVQEQGYITDVFTREAVNFIERHHGDERPFFLYVAYTAPHLPMHAKQQDLKRFDHIPEKKRQTVLAMIWAMDQGIGQILDKLREHQLERDTLVVFFADNGGYERNQSLNTPLRGQKGTLYEGGIRVPFLMQWPAKLEAGKVYEEPVITLDLLPMFAAAAGFSPPGDKPFDGVNLLPHLTGEAQKPPHETLFWRYGNSAVRKGNHKLLVIDNTPQLFDLSSDIEEQNDLSQKNPAIVQALERELEHWNSHMVPAKWVAQYGDDEEKRP